MKRHPAMRRFCVLGLAILLGTAAARADVIWTGAGADNLASTAANWSGGVAPAANDAVVLDAATGKAMTWDLDIPLASWTQDGYTGTVTIATVYGGTGFTNLVVDGNVVLNSGTWTHQDNAKVATYRLRATIGGSLTIGEEAAIDHALDSLRRELGRPGLKPLDALLVDWPNDPFAAGGYSYVRPGHRGVRERLAAPTPPLFWAGEATAPERDAATVHGALLSGERAAQEALGLFGVVHTYDGLEVTH